MTIFILKRLLQAKSQRYQICLSASPIHPLERRTYGTRATLVGLVPLSRSLDWVLPAWRLTGSPSSLSRTQSIRSSKTEYAGRQEAEAEGAHCSKELTLATRAQQQKAFSIPIDFRRFLPSRSFPFFPPTRFQENDNEIED